MVHKFIFGAFLFVSFLFHNCACSLATGEDEAVEDTEQAMSTFAGGEDVRGFKDEDDSAVHRLRETFLPNLYSFLHRIGLGPPPLDGSGCCRRRQNQASCRSKREHLKCFYNTVDGQREMCCPVYPGYPTLYVADCACRCRRVFTRRTFWAICNRNVVNINFRRITRNLATTCSCRANRG